jgi:hypothetical protein
MYGVSTLLRYHQVLGNEFDNLVKWALQKQIHQSQVLLSDICDQLNYSSIFKWVILPRGIKQTFPSIKLQDKVINQLINDSNLKDTLTGNVMYAKHSALDELDQAYILALEAEKIYKRVGYVDSFEAIDVLLDRQLINVDDQQLLLRLTKLRRKILMVDDYED